ncbi:ankyrin repeat protein [Indivirus ILV1]|uniref:Ankyrin repeat protein n=1 Tax=Indivirus ILV1 TaxID=1977633 RepID=A0A1V0SE68_9VIRU|nr:ankyrin repeat protein [Indivirus ILV1]
MDKTKLLQYLTCPITNLIFCDPVLAEDGYFYENMAIQNHLNKNNVSPVTKQRMGSELMKAGQIKALADKFLEENQEYKSDQFLFKKPFYLFKNEFLTLLRDKKFESLHEYTGIILNTVVNRNKESLFEVVCIMCSDETIKTIIDHSIDYDTYDVRNLKPLHIACKYASVDVIRHLLSKNVDINSEDSNGETSFGYLVKHKSKLDNLNKFFDEFLSLGCNINKLNKEGLNVAHYVISHGNLELLKTFLQYGLKLEISSLELGGMNLIHHAFKESKSYDLIKYLIDLNQCLDIDVRPGIAAEQLVYQNVNLTKQQKQELVLLYLNKLVYKPIIVDNFMDSIKKQ